MVQLKKFIFNPLQVNCWLLYDDDGEGILIDPSCQFQDEIDELRTFIDENKIRLRVMVNTHGHFDHLFGAGRIKELYNPEFLIHPEDERFLEFAGEQAGAFGFRLDRPVPRPDRFLEDGLVIGAGNVKLQVIHVPGHSRGGVALYEKARGWLFTGDTLFAGGIGRTDLPGGDYDQIMASINTRLLVLGDDIRIFPGHGGDSTIGEERQSNPFLVV